MNDLSDIRNDIAWRCEEHLLLELPQGYVTGLLSSSRGVLRAGAVRDLQPTMKPFRGHPSLHEETKMISIDAADVP